MCTNFYDKLASVFHKYHCEGSNVSSQPTLFSFIAYTLGFTTTTAKPKIIGPTSCSNYYALYLSSSHFLVCIQINRILCFLSLWKHGLSVPLICSSFSDNGFKVKSLENSLISLKFILVGLRCKGKGNREI